MALKLTYFPVAGRAYATRLCLKAAGIAFEDEKFSYAAFQAKKAGSPAAFPLGQMPVLTLASGQVVTQSGAHFRWAAKKAGLYPREDDDAAMVQDEILITIDEMSAKVPQNSDVEAKKAARAAFVADTLPKYANFFAGRLAGGPFFAGATLSLADLVFYATIAGVKGGNWDFVPADVFSAWPAVDSHFAAVKAHPLVIAHGEAV